MLSWHRSCLSKKIAAVLLPLLLFACSGEQRDPGKVSPASPAASGVTAKDERPSEVSPSAAPAFAPGVETVVSATNAPPEILTVKLEPNLVFPGTRLKAVVAAADPESDLITLDYEWKSNDQILSGEVMDELDTANFRKGDLVTVTVTPFDGQIKGKSKESRPIVILNRPPEITSFPPAGNTDGAYVYEVRATDPDGDALQFSLEHAPPEMSIDADSGRIEWQVPVDLTGNFRIRVVVSDRDAKGFQEFTLNLQKEKKK